MRRLRLLDAAAGDDAAVRRLVTALLVAVFVQSVGAGAVLPLLPLFLRRQGTSPGLVGAVMSAFFVAGVLTQYAAGHATDRAGGRLVMVGGLALYAVASLGFLLDVGAGGYVGLRALQGVGAGAVQVASLALVGVAVPAERRGRAYALVFAAQLGGFALGPLSGTIAGIAHLRWLFVATAALSLVAVAPTLAGTIAIAGKPATARGPRVPVTRPLIGIALVGVSAGLVAGVYEACWSLLMNSRGAHTWQIGLSWTLFCVPFATFSPVAGWLVDHFDRRILAIAGLLSSSAFAVTYPFIPVVPVLMGLGVIEAVGVAIAFPAAQSLLADMVPADRMGRAQGVFTTSENAAIGVGAGVSGALFGVTRWLPFSTAALLSALVVVPLPLLWRQVPGRAQSARRDDEFGDLHGVESGTLAQVVVADEKHETAIVGHPAILAQPPDV
jgi:DHA1 family multidrug resistance protein-like MFS transporter